MATESHEAEQYREEQTTGRGREPDAGLGSPRMRRIASMAVGAVLVVRGLQRRGLRGLAMVGAGGWLVSRGVGGSSNIKEAVQSQTSAGSPRDAQMEAAEPPEVTRSITVGKPPEEVFEAWEDPETFSQIMGHFADVESAGDDRMRWTVHAPGGREITWETHVVESEPGERLRWETPPDALVPNDGTVRFTEASGDRGTEVELTINFQPPGGALGNAAMRRLDIVPKSLVGKALRRFKSLVETGEIPTLEGNPSARGEGDMV